MTQPKQPVNPGDWVAYTPTDGEAVTARAISGREKGKAGRPVYRIQVRKNGVPVEIAVPAGSVRKLEPVPEQPTGNWRRSAA